MTTRTDIHRPSAIIPDDYEYIACELVPGPYGGAMALLPERERIRAHMALTGGTYSRHEHGGNCHICGSVNLIYSILYYHAKSNSYIRMGEDCARKLDFGGTAEMNIFRAKVRQEMELAKGNDKAQRILAEKGLSHLWDIFRPPSTITLQYEEHTIADIVGKLVKYGSVSDKALGFAQSLFDRIGKRDQIAAERAAKDAARADLPNFGDARVKITGTVLSIKGVDTQFGFVTKALIEHSDGWKVYGTLPTLTNGCEKGNVIEFFARIQRSKDDPKFGFFSRPTKGLLIS